SISSFELTSSVSTTSVGVADAVGSLVASVGVASVEVLGSLAGDKVADGVTAGGAVPGDPPPPSARTATTPNTTTATPATSHTSFLGLLARRAEDWAVEVGSG
ncbi:MAG: hypothetical protein WAU30_06475, partial [Propionicimonas sp.]